MILILIGRKKPMNLEQSFMINLRTLLLKLEKRSQALNSVTMFWNLLEKWPMEPRKLLLVSDNQFLILNSKASSKMMWKQPQRWLETNPKRFGIKKKNMLLKPGMCCQLAGKVLWVCLTTTIPNKAMKINNIKRYQPNLNGLTIHMNHWSKIPMNAKKIIEKKKLRC